MSKRGILLIIEIPTPQGLSSSTQLEKKSPHQPPTNRPAEWRARQRPSTTGRHSWQANCTRKQEELQHLWQIHYSN